MKPFHLLRLLIAGLILGLAQSGRAQALDGPVGVAVTFKALDLQWNYNGGGYLDLSIVGLNGYQSVSASYDSETPQLTARLEPGKTYYATVSSDDLGNLTLQAVPPPGYVIEIDQVARERLALGYAGNTSVRIRVLAPAQEYSGRAGTATALTSGRIYWQVALGSLANGSSAGSLAIIDTGAGNFTSLFTPAGLLYEPTSSEVQVFYNPWWVSAPEIPGAIRQIIAPEACVDIITVATNETHIKFYHRDQLLAYPNSPNELRWFSGEPYAWYLINQDGAQPDRVFINCDLRDPTSPTATGQPVVKVKHTVLDRDGSAPNFTWTADEWYEDGASSLSREVHVRSSGTESITVSEPGGATATTASRTYGSVPWGEEIVSATSGTTDAVTTTSDFYTASDQAGNYGRPKSTVTTGGIWEAYEYYDYAGGTADQAGALYRTHRPFKNTDTSVPPNLNQHGGVVTTFEYALDAFGRRTRPSLVETAVNGTVIGRSSTSYGDAASGFSGHPYLYLVTATSSNSVSATVGDVLTSVSKYFREDAGAVYGYQTDDFFRGQIHSVQHPDGRKQSFVYQRGSWDGTNFSLSGNGGTDYGSASRIGVISGTTTNTGILCATYAGYNLDDLYLVDGKSTMEVTIRDKSALVRRTETQVWSSGAWQTVSWVTYAYSYSNQLVSRTTSNNGLYEAFYTGERKDWEKDDSGIRVDYAYDAADRVHTATKSSGPTTTFTYDAEHRALSENVTASGTGENIYSARTYDDAGRLKTELPVGMSTVNYGYNPGARTRTVTYPDASTRTETFFADGQLDHVDGSAVVPEYHDYTIETDGRRTTQVWSGSSSSPRWQKATVDWLGRGKHSERPGFSKSSQANATEDNTYEPGTGRLLKTARSGLASTRYEYDALSNVVRSGLDIGDDGLVNASSDRITESNSYFELDGSGWWLRQESKTYPYANNGTAVTTSISRKRVTGHPANRLDETQITDAEGNTVTRTVDINRATATATITTTRPSVTNAQVETIVNGLATSATGHDGLTSSVQYDALSRAWKSIDPRNNAFTTTYKSGTVLVQSVSDGAGNNLGTNSYDGMGRKEWVQDAAGQYTRFAYNPRGQLTNQWGGGTYPVSFGYDSTYGDRTSMSTYRNAPTGDSTSWPAVGAADATTWNYDPDTGLLWKKTDAGNQVTEFDYNLRGQTSSRKWARTLVNNGGVKLTSSYGYDGNTGELLSQTYNDGGDPIPTPGVSYNNYTRLGQPGTITDGTGTRTFNYNATAPWRLDNETLDSGFYASRVLTRLYDTASGIGGGYGPYTPGFFKGRYIGFELGVAGNQARDQHLNYTTSDLGRFVGVNTRVTVGAARDYVYSYTPSSALISGYAMGPFFGVNRNYEPQRDVLSSIEGKWGGTAVTRYDYTVNALGQRTTAKQSGSAYADYSTGSYSATYNVYNYSARGELETTARYRGDTPTTSPAAADELPARRFEYRYDSLGNRKTSGATGTTSDDSYTVNALNQYTAKDNKKVKLLGTADATSTVAVVGATSTGKKDRAWGVDLPVANSGGPAQGTATVYSAKPGGGSGGADLVRSDTRSWFIPALTQSFSYDADGNMTGDGVWTYTYNAENQLVRMASVLPAGFTGRRLRLDFKYDYQGRRVEKRVYDNDTATETLARRFLYDGWNLIAETDLAGNLQRTFSWGLDLVGSLSASGSVGALLQIDDLAASKTMAAAYDGNGNLAALVNVGTGAIEAAYEYDPSGNLLRSEGVYAKSNPFRFSTKFQDDETGLINYGFRYYAPTLGRFINRDPIAEKGGLNLYGFAGNDGINHWDYLGQSWFSKLLKVFRKVSHQLVRAFTPFRALRSMDRRGERWGENHQQELKMVAAIIASIYTFGAASSSIYAAGTSATATSAGVAGGGALFQGVMAGTISATTAGAAAGIVGGAAAGAVSGLIMSGTVKGMLQGAASGAIMGGIAGYYGNAWTLPRVGATAIGGGLASEVSGGSFRQGALFAGGMALATYAAIKMHDYEWRHSPPRNQGRESASDLLEGSVAGGRDERTWDPVAKAYKIHPNNLPLGGVQGSATPRFFFVNPGIKSAGNFLLELGGGAHDFFSHPFAYDALGFNNARESLFGRVIAGIAGNGAADRFSDLVAGVALIPTIPITAAALVGLSPSTTSMVIQNEAQ
jgi:RHS repeat-associated protein